MDAKINPNEIIKANSRFLRGTLKQSVADNVTGALSPSDSILSRSPWALSANLPSG